MGDIGDCFSMLYEKSGVEVYSMSYLLLFHTGIFPKLQVNGLDSTD